LIDNELLFKKLIEEITESQEDIILMSSEAFQNCNPAHVHYLFRNFKVKIVIYIRNQLSYLSSAYCQKIHATGFSESIEIFQESFQADYLKFYNLWKSKFLSENIFVRIFDRNYLYNRDIVEDFFYMILYKKFGISVNI
jgi:hypothetical protein